MKVSSFKHGSHPAEFKEYTEHKTLEPLPIPEEVFIPVIQHIGAPCKPVVKVGDEVKTGQLIAESTGFVSSNIHSSITGKVKKIGDFPHPNGTKSPMIQIVAEGDEEWVKVHDHTEPWGEMSVEQLKKIIADAGIVGMGGAAFPTNVKVSPPRDKKIETFIINGCECEPYLTADHRMMVEQAKEMIEGTQILMKILDVEKAFIGIESNKPDAIEIMQKSTEHLPGITIIPLKVKYPQGAEKMLIKAVNKREVPAGSLPMDVGCVVNNVGTAIAVYEAVVKKIPSINRIVTVTGDAVTEPKNVIARIGTPFSKLIEFCGGLKPDTKKILMGGPMMGVAQYSLDVPVVKATSGILCLTKKSVPYREEFTCIVCGRCVHACPMFLVPTRIARAVEAGKFEMADELGIMNCIECGSCAYECPSNIPLVQRIRIGKNKIREMKNKKS
ncbi:MAG: electron transport complex subunit RsxC [Candidatus Marinimicrobia bacterium]|nr:electron transport complex subunit RsxC [Candidatus Neomarinimicrobiota bacterium]